jgi:hypothetical protein
MARKKPNHGPHVCCGLPGSSLYLRNQGRHTDTPANGFTNAWLCCGRRSGKSRMLAMVSAYLAVFRDWKPYLSPGEVPTVMVIAADKKQARVIFRYTREFLRALDVIHGRHEKDSEWQVGNSEGRHRASDLTTEFSIDCIRTAPRLQHYFPSAIAGLPWALAVGPGMPVESRHGDRDLRTGGSTRPDRGSAPR